MAAEDKELELWQQFAGMEPGTVVKFVRGEDFTTAAGTFRNRLHREMRHEGWVVRSSVKGDEVFAELKRRAGEPAADESATRELASVGR